MHGAFIALFFLLLSLWPSPASAQKLRVGYYPIRDDKLALWVARDAGIFTKHGLDVALISFPRGPTTVAALLSKEIDIGVLGFRHGVRPLTEGADFVFLASFSHHPFILVAPPEIKSPQDLKGKRIWTAALGAGPDVSTRLVLRHLGVDPEKDVQLISCSGCHSSRGDRERPPTTHPPGLHDNPSIGVRWMFERKVSASLSQRGQLRDLEREGKKVHVLADFINAGLYVTAADVMVRREWLGANRDMAKRFLKALIEATAYAKSHKDFSDATYKKYLLKEFAHGMETKYEDYVLGVLPKKPVPLTKGLEISIEELAPGHPFFRQKKAADFIDASLIEEIDKEGFFQQAYR